MWGGYQHPEQLQTFSTDSLVAQLVKNLPAVQETQVPEDPYRRKWQTTLAFLPGKLHGQRSRGQQSMRSQESDMTERLNHHHYRPSGLPWWLRCQGIRLQWETQVQPLRQEDALEKGMATHSILPGQFHGRRSMYLLNDTYLPVKQTHIYWVNKWRITITSIYY